MTNENDKTTQCPICKEKILAEAAKCTHCGSFQNWRRYLNFSSSVLSLIIALISVATVFVTVVVNSTSEKNSDIDVSIVNWQRTFIAGDRMYQSLNVEIFVTNSGQRPGAVKTVAIKGDGETEFQFMRSESSATFNDYLHEGVESQIVEPGKTLLIKKHFRSLLTVDEIEVKYANADLRVQVVNFNGKEEEIILEIRNTPPVFYR